MSAATPNHKLFNKVKLFSITSDEGLQGCGLYHSYGVNLCGVRTTELSTSNKKT